MREGVNMKKILVIDNFDSFVYNIPQVIARNNKVKVDVVRNNQLTNNHFCHHDFSHVVISPGPGNPTRSGDFGNCADIIEYYVGKVPILGICLGHQGIAAHYGATISTAKQIMHGHTSDIQLVGDCPLFLGVDSLTVMRYHSLVVETGTLPKNFQLTATTYDKHNEIMAYNDLTQGLFAVQFHPESVATEAGERILNNFVNIN